MAFKEETGCVPSYTFPSKRLNLSLQYQYFNTESPIVTTQEHYYETFLRITI